MVSKEMESLIQKLASPVEEIRARTLENLSFKLESGLISDLDRLLEETPLLANLLLSVSKSHSCPEVGNILDFLHTLIQASSKTVTHLIRLDGGKILQNWRARENRSPELETGVNRICADLLLQSQTVGFQFDVSVAEDPCYVAPASPTRDDQHLSADFPIASWPRRRPRTCLPSPACLVICPRSRWRSRKRRRTRLKWKHCSNGRF